MSNYQKIPMARSGKAYGKVANPERGRDQGRNLESETIRPRMRIKVVDMWRRDLSNLSIME
jgi:hypothetical protein